MEDRIKLEEESIEWYIINRPIYKKLAQKVESIVTEILELKNISFHIVTSRSKDIDSFKTKILVPNGSSAAADTRRFERQTSRL